MGLVLGVHASTPSPRMTKDDRYLQWREPPKHPAPGWYIQISAGGVYWRKFLSQRLYKLSKTKLKRLAVEIRDEKLDEIGKLGRLPSSPASGTETE